MSYLHEFLTFIADHLNEINELTAVCDIPGGWLNPLPDASIDRVVYAFKPLESLAVSLCHKKDGNMIQLLR